MRNGGIRGMISVNRAVHGEWSDRGQREHIPFPLIDGVFLNLQIEHLEGEAFARLHTDSPSNGTRKILMIKRYRFIMICNKKFLVSAETPR